MTSVWSGGIVYMYFQEANDFGLVSVSGNTVSKLQDFSNLSSRLATVTPSGVNSASYSPSNSPASCPATGTSWAAAATPLPPTPNQQLCSCMYNSLQCVVSGSVDESNYGDLFGTVCGYSKAVGKDVCAGIEAYGNNATYGAYSMCNSTEQLAFVLNYYYQLEKGSNPSACNFGGSAMTKAATSASACTGLLNQAGSAGTGSVTSQPSGTGAVGGGSSGGSSASGSASKSTGAASGVFVHHAEVGFLSIAFYAGAAVLSGAAMILL